MIEVNTAKLIGPALDWAVAKAGYGCEPWQLDEDTLGTWYAGECSGGIKDWRPSTDWSQGGPLIAKHDIEFVYIRGELAAFMSNSAYERGDPDAYGPDHLIAACRAIVADKMGGAVQVPDELVRG